MPCLTLRPTDALGLTLSGIGFGAHQDRTVKRVPYDLFYGRTTEALAERKQHIAPHLFATLGFLDTSQRTLATSSS